MRNLKFAGPALLALWVAPIGAQEPPKKFNVDLSDERVGEPAEEKY